ncbi:MAG: hypothetical protein KF729_03555 [Sandaracinaceae bacterium]|nr:hypothetical protein [Sandaracinaceae bacterium]
MRDRTALLHVALLALACSGPSSTAAPSEPERPAPPPRPYELRGWTMNRYDAGEPPSVWLPVLDSQIPELRDGFGWVSLDDHVVWLNLRQRERAGALRPPISVAITAEELCDEAVQRMLRGWEGQPYALEILDDWTGAEIGCLRGLAFQYLATSFNQGESHCDRLIAQDLLPRSLRGLAVMECSPASLRALAGYPELRQLAIGVPAGPEAVASLAALERLEVLDVTLDHGGAVSLAQLPPLPALRRLVVGGTHALGREDAEAIARMRSLRELAITARTLDEFRDALAAMPALRSLDLATVELDAGALRRLVEASDLVELRVGLAERLDDEAVALLRDETSLEVLELRGAALTDRGLDALAGLERLWHLDLTGARITTLGPLRGLARLRSLGLAGTRATDAELSTVARLRELRVLDLRRAPISTLDPLASLPNLRVLRAAETLVGDESIPTLRAMSSLREVDLDRTRATGPAIERLASARPDMRISGARSIRVPTR